jgi:hypothetical protein
MKELTSKTPVLSPVNGKPVPLNFDGAEISSDAGLTLPREIERRPNLEGLMAFCITDLRYAGKLRRSLEGLNQFRMMMIAADHENGNDAADPRIHLPIPGSSGISPP